MDSLLFPLSFTKFQCKKKIERTLFSSVSTQKRWETAGSGATLPQYLPNPKKHHLQKKKKYIYIYIYIYFFYFILTSFLKACVHYFLINFYFFTL